MRSKHTYMLIPIYAHNFIMRTGTPHMRIFLDPRTFTYGDSPYAYGDQFLDVALRVSDLKLSHA